jgi:drug/metabolite transporter (DMT)-like permease
MSPERTRAVVELLLTVAAVSLVLVLAKPILSLLPVTEFLWLQLLTAVMVLSLLVVATHRGTPVWPRLHLRHWLWIAGMGLLNFGVVRFCWLASLELLPATLHAYLINLTSVTTMLLSGWLLRERPSSTQWLGAAVVLASVTLFFGKPPATDQWLGLALLAAGVLALAGTNILTRKVMQTLDGSVSVEVISLLALTAGSLPVWLGAPLLGSDWRWPSAWEWSVILVNGAVAVALGLWVFNRALRHLHAYEASLLATSGVVFTALFAGWLLGEHLSARQWAAVGMMGLGLMMTQRRRLTIAASGT